MRITVVTIFPGFFTSPLQVGVVGRAIDAGLVAVDTDDPRRYGKGAHRQVDDAPFGGGAGMVMMVDPLARTLEPLAGSHRVLLTPAAPRLEQAHLDRFAALEHLTLVCGRYEGVDQRVADNFIDESLSLGDFVLAGGEVAALAVIEGVARLVPGVVGNAESVVRESFRDGLLEEPVYTRPAEYRGWKVPDVLLSGDHGAIERWREAQRLDRTRRVRPDLLDGVRPPPGRPPSES